jgi:predicted ATPase
MIHIKELHLKGYMSIADAALELKPLNVMIGANGAGKTNILCFFQMLQRLATGSLSVFMREMGGANVLLHRGAKRTSSIKSKLVLQSEHAHAPHTMRLHLRHAADDTLIVDHEDLRGSSPSGGEDVELFSREPGGTESAIGPNAASELARTLHRQISSWRPYHFHDTSPSSNLRITSKLQDSLYLKQDGENLAAYLYMLKETWDEHYKQIRDTVRLAAPFFDDFVLQPTGRNKDSILLRWRDRWSPDPFGVSQLSDGTLRFICLATLLLQPEPPGLILIDEPELGLHPTAITLLASMLGSASQKSQVLVTTQSVTLLDHFTPGEILVAERDRGPSVFKRLDPNALQGWLEDYTIGELWEKNVLGGKP